MFKKYDNIPVVLPEWLDKDNKPQGLLIVDQFPAQEFNRGANGFPANDITLLARATSQKEYDMILSRLREIQVSQPDNSKKSNRQIISEIMPSWVQTPAEIEHFMDWYNSLNPVAVSTTDDVVDKDECEVVDDVNKSE